MMENETLRKAIKMYCETFAETGKWNQNVILASDKMTTQSPAIALAVMVLI